MAQRPPDSLLSYLVAHIDQWTDDELLALADAVKAGQERRFRLRRGVSWVDEITRSIREGRSDGESPGDPRESASH